MVSAHTLKTTAAATLPNSGRFTPRHFLYFVVLQIIGPAVINGCIAWALVKNRYLGPDAKELGVWRNSVVLDAAITILCISFPTWLIVSASTTTDLKSQRITPLLTQFTTSCDSSLARVTAKFTGQAQNILTSSNFLPKFLRASFAGLIFSLLICTTLLPVSTAIAYAVWGRGSIDGREAVWFQIALGGVVGVVASCLACWLALVSWYDPNVQEKETEDVEVIGI